MAALASRVALWMLVCVLLCAPRVGAVQPPRPAAPALSAAAVQYRAPVPIVVVRAFDPPRTRYGPGHRGVDLSAPAGSAVLAAGAGTVSFAGPVAGRTLVVIAHADGVRTEYEPVRPLVRRGQRVAAGTVVGRLLAGHPGCARPCLHWGARRDGDYLDPLSLLSPLGPVRLLPWSRAPDL